MGFDAEHVKNRSVPPGTPGVCLQLLLYAKHVV